MGVNQVDSNVLAQMLDLVPSRVQTAPLEPPPHEVKSPQPIEADVRAGPLIEVETFTTDSTASKGKDILRAAQQRLAEQDARAQVQRLQEADQRSTAMDRAISERDANLARLELENARDRARVDELRGVQDRFTEEQEVQQSWRQAFTADKQTIARRFEIQERDAADLQRAMDNVRDSEQAVDRFRELAAQDKAAIHDFRANFQEDAANERAFRKNFSADAANERAFQALFSSDVSELDRFWNQYFETLDKLYEYWSSFDEKSFENMRGFLANFAEDVQNLAHLQGLAEDQRTSYLNSVFSEILQGKPPSPPPQAPEPSAAAVPAATLSSSTTRPAELPAIKSTPLNAAPPDGQGLTTNAAARARQTIVLAQAQRQPAQTGDVPPDTTGVGRANQLGGSIKHLAKDWTFAQKTAAIEGGSEVNATSSHASPSQSDDAAEPARNVMQAGLVLPGVSDWVRSAKTFKPPRDEQTRDQKDQQQHGFSDGSGKNDAEDPGSQNTSTRDESENQSWKA